MTPSDKIDTVDGYLADADDALEEACKLLYGMWDRAKADGRKDDCLNLCDQIAALGGAQRVVQAHVIGR